MSEPLLSLHGIQKSFGGIRALRPLDLELRAGEILGLVGENGAGKSTLIKLLSGVYRPDAGRVVWRGRTAGFASPHDALAAGIATIHQELEYFGRLSVAENMLLAERWPRRWWGGVDWPRLHQAARSRLAAFELEIPSDALFDSLSAAERQEVAIATALAREARLLILDEPTASLSEHEAERLFARLKRLHAQGVTIVYVSHRLDEVFRNTSRIAVLRDGALVGLHATSDTSPAAIVAEMVGRPLEQVYPHTRGSAPGEPLLELEGVTCDGLFRDVSLSVRAGEIVGLAGLVGAGRSELARAIFGLYPLDGGRMRLRGREWRPRSPRDALAQGLVYLPEERKRQGLVLDHSVRESISIGFLDRLARFGLVDRRRERSSVAELLRAYDVRTATDRQPVGTLSGGNQQKALLARWLRGDPHVLLLDEPTRGIDVGAKVQIHALVDGLAASGKAVLYISSDLAELVGMSDRVLVLNRGTIVAELAGDELTEHNVLLAASGLEPAAAL
jgi:rhamnose transport system ATP-binding protein